MPLGGVALGRNRSRPRAVQHYFGDQSSLPVTVNTTTGITIDTGQNVNCINIGQSMTIDSSPMGDGAVVANTAPTGTSYFTPTVAQSSPTVYMGAEFRFSNAGGASQNDVSFAMISWSSRNLGTVDTSTHLVVSMANNTVFVQKMVNGAFTGGGAAIGGPFSVSVQDSNWHTIEWALDRDNNAMVIRLDGKVFAFTEATVGVVAHVFPCWEPFYSSFNANRNDPEFRIVHSASAADLEANWSARQHVNDLLRAGGYGPLPGPVSTVATIVAVGVAHAASAVEATLEAYPGGGAFTCTAGDRIVTFTVNDDGATAPALLTDFTDIGSLAGNLCGMRGQQKKAVGTETTGGASALGDCEIVVVLRGCRGIGAFSMNQGGSTTLTVDPLTCQDTTNTSRIIVMGYHAGGSDTAGLATPPSGMTVLKAGESSLNDIYLYHIDSGQNSYAGGTITATNHSWKTFIIEARGN